jgi:hypothetical protein
LCITLSGGCKVSKKFPFYFNLSNFPSPVKTVFISYAWKYSDFHILLLPESAALAEKEGKDNHLPCPFFHRGIGIFHMNLLSAIRLKKNYLIDKRVPFGKSFLVENGLN